MNKILCYGDSNTFGLNPADFSRYAQDERWSGILKKTLADKYDLIESGANNRTAFAPNPQGELYCALKHLPKICTSKSYDILVLSVGTNDLQFQYGLDSLGFEKGYDNLISRIKPYFKEIIIVPGVKLKPCILNSMFKEMFDQDGIDKSHSFIEIYSKAAKKYSCKFFDFNEFVSPSDIDGVHYTIESHKLIAERFANYLISM